MRVSAEYLLKYEREKFCTFPVIAGVDEAGRGPLAGPVVAACVVMGEGAIPGVADSKTVSEQKREMLYDVILANAAAWGVGIVDAKTIDEVNILNATKLAFSIAYQNMDHIPSAVIIDGRDAISLPVPCFSVIKGDGCCYSIAAASIIAKVTRDRIMRDMDGIYPGYGFSKHKGYGTAEHIAALRKLGPCAEHRRLFIRKFV